MQMCEQQVRACPRHTHGNRTEGVELLKRRWHKWALAMHEQNGHGESRNIESKK